MLLEVAGLSIDLPTHEGARRIVSEISFTLGAARRWASSANPARARR